ncbi:hypothetical protein GXW74_15550 [Roseomonas eburnea]|uniref:Phage tail assembly protein n=1 Tax=Neoroseomonas eburnea TaxID=1346889 RepID=A0A9X9XDX3_9PROT|nr:phage tail assembly protein [Neoroseomonas eburnea]MBR0681909.1 hypothetical protein [Neoroseomonas eburnea]
MADIAPAEDVIVEIEEEGAAVAAASSPADPDVVVIDEDDDGKGLPKHAVRRRDGTIELPLSVPVTLRYRRGQDGPVREESLDRLVLHRLTGADMRAISAASKDAQITVMIARCARINEAKFGAIFDKMDGADVGFAARVVEHFLSSGPRTGT